MSKNDDDKAKVVIRYTEKDIGRFWRSRGISRSREGEEVYTTAVGEVDREGSQEEDSWRARLDRILFEISSNRCSTRKRGGRLHGEWISRIRIAQEINHHGWRM